MDMELEMRDISRKWVAIIGVGYNPDTPADDYSPALTKDQQREYAFDMRKLRRTARVHRMPPGPDRWKERSRTYGGIAEAMAAQWGK